ncbi:hypothetical protein LTR50_002213 [Elasticomyces elasticus]|nr:hypothetical protein LTR50_002213 [Elasticomyces elasticus]
MRSSETELAAIPHRPTCHREDTDMSGLPTKTAGVRQEQLEISELYNQSTRDVTANSDSYGSALADKRDMQRMGKEQQMRGQYPRADVRRPCGPVLVVHLDILRLWPHRCLTSGDGIDVGLLLEERMEAPTSGGQYHWVSEFAPPRYQKLLSYVAGWMSTLCWQAGNASGGFMAGILIQALIALKNPDYSWANWQGTLLVFPVMIICAACNIYFAHALPIMQNVIVALHVIGFCAIIVVLWVLAPHVPASTALLEFTNAGG